MQRVLILGSPGAGKSTLARQLALRTALPLHHMDRLYWCPGWIERARTEWLPTLEGILQQPRWILDGNYGSTLALRLPHADTVILLDYPTRTCLLRALRRIVTGWGRDRPDMADGCPERFDLAFLAYVLRFRTRQRPAIVHELQTFRGTLLRFRHPAELAAWLAAGDRAVSSSVPSPR